MRRGLSTRPFWAQWILTLIGSRIRTSVDRPALTSLSPPLVGPSTPAVESTDRSQWRVGPGPFGRGNCISTSQAGAATMILAPPGVPLAPPEAVIDLARWRFARWTSGGIVSAPEALTVEEALTIAPCRRAWILDRTREQYERDAAADHFNVDLESSLVEIAFAGAPRRIFARRDDARRCLDAIAKDGISPLKIADYGPHALAAFVGACPARAPIKELARAANRPLDLSEFRAHVARVTEDVGTEPVRDALIALLHARARCRSWRYSRPFERNPSETGLVQALSEEIDRAPSARALEHRLRDLEPHDSNLTAELTTILHARSHSWRWRGSHRIRVVLASRSLSGLRRCLLALRVRIEARMQKERRPASPPLGEVPAVPDTGAALLAAIDSAAVPEPRVLGADASDQGQTPARQSREHRTTLHQVKRSRRSARVLTALLAGVSAVALITGSRLLIQKAEDSTATGWAPHLALDASGSTSRLTQQLIPAELQRGAGGRNELSWFAQSSGHGRWIWIVQQSDRTIATRSAPSWSTRETTTLQSQALRPIASGSFDSYISSWARHFKAVRKPVHLWALPDIAGSSDGERNMINVGSSALVRRATRRMQAIFRAQGALNVRWVATPHVAGGW
jgi:hypothetical protein